MISSPIFCPRFIGRKPQLELLLERCRAAREGRGSIVLVAGEAGLGKTRLVAEMRTALGDAMGNSTGRCLEYAQSPFGPFVEALRGLGVGSGRTSPLVADDRNVLARLLPELAESAAESEPAADKRRQFEAFVGALRAFAALRPTLVVLEDLQWADVGTLELLQHVARPIAALPMLIVATYRTDELQHGHPLVTALPKLERGDAAWRIELAPLNAWEMRSLVTAALGQRAHLPSEVVHALITQAEGNPLVAEEMLRSTLDGRAVGGGGEVPLSVREAVLLRMAGFSEDERSVIKHAAVIGRRFRPEFLAAIMDRRVEDVVPALKSGLRGQLLIEEREGDICYSFRHALTRGAVYGELLAVETRSLHEKIARVLEADDVPERHAAELAYHWWAAHNREKAAHWNEAAGDRAREVCCFDDAASCFERAIESAGVGKTVQAARLWEKLGEALYMQGHGERATRSLERSLALYEATGGSEEIARVCLILGALRFNAGNYAVGHSFTERAVALAETAVEPSDTLYRALVNLAWDYVYLDDLERAAEILQRAAGLAGSRALPNVVKYHETSGGLCAALGDATGSHENYSKAVELAAQIGDAVIVTRSSSNFALTIHRRLGQSAQAATLFEWGLDYARQRHFVGSYYAYALLWHAQVSHCLGRLERAREVLEEALAVGVDDPRFMQIAATVGIPLGLELEHDLVERCGDPHVLDAALAAGAGATVRAAIGYVELYVSRGQLEDARELLHTARLALSSLSPLKAVDGGILSDEVVDYGSLLRVLIAMHGAADDVEAVRGIHLGASSAPGKAFSSLFDAFAEKRFGSREAAAHAADEAARRFHELGWPYFEALAREAAGDKEGALDIYRAIGDIRDARRLEAALSPVNRRGRPPSALTSREREVAELAAKGKSNKDISEALVISERTVESHVSSIFAKLGVTNRVELAAKIGHERSGVVQARHRL